MGRNERAVVFSAPKAILNVSKKYDYPIYKKIDDKKYKLLTEKNNTYDKNSCAFFKKDGSDMVFINIKDKIKYQSDIQEHISNIIDNDNVCMNVKANLINDIAKETISTLFEDDITFESLKDVDDILNHSIDFILSDELSMKTMLKVTSYDYYTSTHCIDVSTYAIGFGSFLNLEKKELKLLGKAALLHDIGKKDIDIKIIAKNGKLSSDELEIVKNHPTYSADILRTNGEKNTRLLNIVEQHHEKCDGSGYPKGLKSHEIDEFAKIVSICDIFNALTTKRTYKEKMSTYEAIELMYKYMNNQLSLSYLDKFVKFMKLS